MPRYILRTHPAYTLVIPEDAGNLYRNGDQITLSEERAREIAHSSKVHRFERVGAAEDTPLLGHDRHRSGRHLRGESAPPLAGSDQDTTTTATTA